MVLAIFSIFFGVINFYHNIFISVGCIFLGVLFFFCAVKVMQIYLGKQYMDKLAFDSCIDFLSKCRSKTVEEKATLFNSLVWAGNIDGLDRYVTSNGLSLMQNISLELSMVDRYLFFENDEKRCLAYLECAKKNIYTYVNLPKVDSEMKNYFNSILAFYEAYIGGNIEGAISTISNASNEKPVNVWKKYHLAKCYEKIGDVSKTEECYEFIKKQKGTTRFHKWLGYSNEDNIKCSATMIFLAIVCFVFLGAMIVISNAKHSSISDALNMEYGIKVSEDKCLYSAENREGAVCIYLKDNNIVYCYYEKSDGNCDIKRVYIDKNTLIDNSSYESFFAASNLIRVEHMFYNDISVDLDNVVVTKSDTFDNSVIDESLIGAIDEITLDNSEFYLVNVQGD